MNKYAANYFTNINYYKLLLDTGKCYLLTTFSLRNAWRIKYYLVYIIL